VSGEVIRFNAGGKSYQGRLNGKQLELQSGTTARGLRG
jgi:hypothetical protein